jgi:transcriptional repressor NrdR
LAPLRELDEVAYLRFASVYRSFSSLEDFEGEIALLRAAPSTPASKSTTAVNTPEKVLTAPSRTATPSK